MKEKLQLIGAFFLPILFGLVFFSSGAIAKTQKVEMYPVRVYFFHTDTCPVCREEKAFLDEELIKNYPNVDLHSFEAGSFKGQSLMKRAEEHYKFGGYVPVTIINDEAIVGFNDELADKMVDKIKSCSSSSCNNWLDNVLGLKKVVASNFIVDLENYKNSDEKGVEMKERVNKDGGGVKVFGLEISKDSSMFLLGIALGLADGVNPCMFSVLIFLLTYLIGIGSRRKAVKAGIAFIVTTFVVYVSFMYGILKVMDILKIAHWVRWGIIGFCWFAGVVMIKDFFFYGKWFSLEIPKKYKPVIEKFIKKGTLPSVILLALFASIVELPCTSGLPLAYTTILASRNLEPFWYLIWYNLFFVLPLLVIILLVAFAWAKVEKIEKIRLDYRKYMRLIAGVLLILLGVAIWQNWL